MARVSDEDCSGRIPNPLLNAEMADTAYSFGELSDRFRNVSGRIEACARRCERSPKEITLVAISKTHPIDTLRTGLSLGLQDFGENRVQEAESKILQLGRNAARWHLVGHLQENKARRAVKLFDFIHTLDSAALARRLDRLCGEEGREQLPVLIQINLAKEESKAGVAEAALEDLLEAVKKSERLRLVGLMTLPPFFEDAERVRPFFRRLRELRDDLHAQKHFGEAQGELSMGMSHDFEVAIEEGATMLRIGTAIFGERNPIA